MGGIFSSSVIQPDGCLQLDERTTYILVRNYVVILKMISYVEMLIDGKAQAFEALKSNYAPYLVDDEAMLQLVKELPQEISQFAGLNQMLVGSSSGSPVYKEITFYTAYNNFFITEQYNFDTYEEVEDRLKEMVDNLKQKSSMVESLISSACVKEVGVSV